MLRSSQKKPPSDWVKRGWSQLLEEINPTPSSASPALEHVPNLSKSTIPPTEDLFSLG